LARIGGNFVHEEANDHSSEKVEEFFRQTESAIMDLDQAVALLAGMTVLGFSLYSAAEE
jgi:hypothetical protein